MKSIWLKLLGLIKGNKVTTFIVVLVLALLAIVYFQHQRIQHWKDKYDEEVNIVDVLNDSITYYQNKHKEWVAEKQSFQTSIEKLEEINGKLTDFQKELLVRIKEIEKKNSIIAAALIQTNVKIDSLMDKDAGGTAVIDTTNKKINFNNLASKDSTFRYDIDAFNVLPAHLDTKPTLTFNSIQLPNKQFVDFYWKDDRKKGYPVTFSVSNSNPYFKVVNLESYIIPNVDKKYLDPNGWQKIGNFIFKNGKTILYVSVGAAAGAGAVYLLTR